MNAEMNSKVLNKFECQRCTECCKQPGFVYLKEEEAEQIAAFLQEDVYSFTEKYCDIQDRSWMVLKKKKNSETCIMLNDDSCGIHPVKPLQCRDFPVKWRTVNSFSYCAGLKKILPSAT